MKTYSLFMTLIACIIFVPACKKGLNQPEPVKKNISIPLTATESDAFTGILKKEGVKDADDFLEKVNYVKSLSSGKTVDLSSARTTDNNALLMEGTEEAFIGFHSNPPYFEDNFLSMSGDFIQVFHLPCAKIYKVMFQQFLTFAKRGNQIMVTAPVGVAIFNDNRQWRVSKIAPIAGMPPGIQPVGGFWGSFEQRPAYSYINCSVTNGNAHAEGKETRSRVYAFEGHVKVSTSTDISVFKVGAELEAGFTIQKAENIYNQYYMDATFQVGVSGSGDCRWSIPTINISGAATCKQYGVIAN